MLTSDDKKKKTGKYAAVLVPANTTIETGLFINMANAIIIGHADGSIEIKEK